MSDTHSGGCQCGAVRYQFTSKPGGAHLCHCRMCQKAFGGFYAALVGADIKDFEVTRGAPTYFNSSDVVKRGFCGFCGTPLIFADVAETFVAVSIGSLDDPELFPPMDQHGIESRLSYANDLGHLPDVPVTEDKDPQNARVVRASNHQHPDFDTKVWTVGGNGNE